MLTRVATWIAMTNAVSAAAICARAEVPPSSVSGARSAVREIIAGCCAPAILASTFSLERLGAVRSDRYLHTRDGARSVQVRTGTRCSQPIARKGTHKIKQIARVASEVSVTEVGEPNMQHAHNGNSPYRSRFTTLFLATGYQLVHVVSGKEGRKEVHVDPMHSCTPLAPREISSR